MAIEVFADIACPFTHIGLVRFVAARAARGRDDVLLRVHAWPLEVVNDSPLDPGFIEEEIAAIGPQVDGEYFDGFTASSFPSSTISAMALASAAYDAGEVTGEAVSLELRRLLFRDGIDVGDPKTLSRVAGQHSVDFDPEALDAHRSVVLADHELGRERGVTGSPHFFTPRGDFFCPALSVGRDESDNLVVDADDETFAAFLAACFA